MKFFTALLFVLLTAWDGLAQHLRYKDIFPQFPTMSNDEIKNTLKEYISTDLDHPNANFRLALAYEKSYKTADPLTDTEYLLANAAQAKIRFFKAKQLVDEREVRKNDDYYFQIFKLVDSQGKPFVSFSVVSNKITKGYDSAEMYLNKVPAIQKKFSKSVDFYDQAVKLFAAINDQYLTRNDLFMSCNDETIQYLNALEAAYDSATFNFDQYLVLSSQFPVTQHKEKYSVRPINTYRLDGLLTNINFLTPKVEFWDYASWAIQIKSFVNADVQSLRKRIAQEEEKLDQSLKKIEESTGTGVDPITLEKQLTYNLNNLDRQSLVLSLFNYKAFKQQWLIKGKVFVPDTILSFRNAENYSALFYFNRSTDTLLRTVKSRLLPEKILKHPEFLTKYYGNKSGLDAYVAKENEFIENTFKDYTLHLRHEVIGLITQPVNPESDKTIKFGKWNIPTKVSPMTQELIDKGDPITLRSIKSFDGSVYLSGIYKADKKLSNVSSFVIHINADGKASWVKNFEYKIDSLSKLADANNFCASLELTKEGCAVVIHTVGTLSESPYNTFVYLGDKGEEKLKIKLKETAYPRQLSYSEKSNSFILVMKGIEEKNNYSSSEPLTILGINILGDAMWTRSIELTGDFTQLINLEGGHMVIGNYMIINDLNKREHRTKIASFESNPFIIKFDNQGDVKNIIPITVSRSARIIKILKVNDNSIHLIGKEEALNSTGDNVISPEEKLVHIMVNRYGQTVYSNQ